MRNVMKKLFALVMVLTFLLNSNVLPTKAAVSGVLSYEVVSGKAVITDCNMSVSGDYVIPSTIDGYSVVKISDYAFSGCNRLTSVVIPEGVTNIGSYAFAECDNLLRIDIPTTVTSIDTFAFYNCESLSEITLPTSVATVSNSLFKGCGSLTSVTLPTGVTSIGTSAFEGCTSLTSISIPEKVSSIGQNAFYKCSSLENVTIPSKVTAISNYLFYECSSLKTVSFLGNLVSIGANAFAGCTSLTNMEIPSTVTNIGMAAFNGCSSLVSVTIPAGVKTISNSTFNGCSSLENVILPVGLTSIGSYAFCGCKKLTEIVIPEGVTGIGYYTFAFCEQLVTVDMPNTITTIENGAFENAYKLQNITIPLGVTNIGASAFAQCKSLTGLVLPDTITKVGVGAFKSCENLQTINIPSQVTSIESSLFYSCVNLSEIKIPAGVTSIGDSAFYGCEKVEEVEIPYGVKEIGAGAFQKCKELDKITIPYSVTSLGEYVFTDSTNVVIYTTSEYVRDYAITYHVDYVWVVDELYIKELPSKTEYDLNEELSLQGLVLQSVCDGEDKDITEGYAVTGFDSSMTGTRTITVTYGGKSTTYNVTIHDYTEWNEVITPTYSSEGKKERVCNECGKIESEVVEKYIPTSITLNKSFQRIFQGETYTFIAECEPYVPATGEVVWSSSNKSVLTIDENGQATTIACGRTTVIASIGEKSVQCEVVVEPVLEITSATLQLENNISVIFKTKAAELDRYYMECYAKITQELENGETKESIVYAKRSADRNYYEFIYTGVDAKEITDNINVKLYAYDDYGLVEGKTEEPYSVMQYCKNQLLKTASDLNMSEEKTAAFKTLLVDLVNYGSEAQRYFGYKTNALAREQLNEEDKMLASSDSVLEGLQQVTDICYKTIENPSAHWKSGTLLLRSKTTIRVKFKYEGDVDGIQLYAKMESGNTYVLNDCESEGDGVYYFLFDSMSAFEMGDAIEFYIVEDGNVISNTLRYSVESYVVSKWDNTTVGPVVKALTKYGKAAVRYKATE